MAELVFPDPPLADEIVALRAFREADLGQLCAGFGDPSVLAHSWPLTTAYTEVDGRAFLAGQEPARAAGEELALALVSPDDPAALLGGGSLHAVDTVNGRASVGYWLAPRARGRGVATHATRLMAGWAFSALRIVRLELTCAPDNPASQRVAERCGFTREAVLRSQLSFKGGRRDTVVFSLLASEFGARDGRA